MRYTILILFAVFFSCAIAQERIQIKQIPSDDQVRISYDTIQGRIWGVVIKVVFEFRHNYPEDIRIFRAGHHRTEEFGTYGGGTSIFIKIDDDYIPIPYPIDFEGRKYPNPGYYKVGTVRYFRADSDILDSLAIYAKEMETKRLTHMDAGTLDEFKARHPVLTRRLLKTDSITFRIVNRESFKAVEYIKVPIKIDLP